jgi:hypothetical protein
MHMKCSSCFASYGLTQLCAVACPNNRLLAQELAVECQDHLELSDDLAALKVEFANRSAVSRTVKLARPPQSNRRR